MINLRDFLIEGIEDKSIDKTALTNGMSGFISQFIPDELFFKCMPNMYLAISVNDLKTNRHELEPSYSINPFHIKYRYVAPILINTAVHYEKRIRDRALISDSTGKLHIHTGWNEEPPAKTDFQSLLLHYNFKSRCFELAAFELLGPAQHVPGGSLESALNFLC